MACAQKSAIEYLKENRSKLVTHMRNLPLIIDNLYQQKVFIDHDVNSVKAEMTEFDKARFILDQVIKKGKEASYELLKILDVTQKRTLHPDLHSWICCFPIRLEDAEASYSFGTKPCQNYQMALKKKAKSILMDRREHCSKYLDDKAQVNVHFIPVVLKTDSVVKTSQCKIKLKSKKYKKVRPKKLRAYIPNEQQTLSPVDLLKAQDKNILLIGKPGIGKTTVVQEMMRLWAEKEDRQWYYMFYFDESVLAHSSRVANLESFLFDVYLKPMDKDRKEVFEDIEENSENVVVVFDGIVDLERNSVIWKIMNHELLSDAKIVITCRSEVEYDPLFSDWPTWKVYVQGFSEESINTFYQNTLSHDQDVVLKNQELFSLSHVPMYAFMIADLIRSENDNVFNHPHSVTEMYIHIFRAAVKKHGKKKNKQIDGYLKEIKDQLHLLMEKAFSATRQKNLNLPDVSIDETDVCHAFLKMITTRDSPTSATTYCAFQHNTMQEFFSALWLFGNPDEIEKVLKLCQTEEHKHMRHVLPFLCGLMGEHNIKLIKCLFTEDQIKKTSEWFFEKLLDTFLQPESESEEFDLLYVCQCLYELQSPKACLMFLEKMDHQLEPEVDLDPHQCCALAYVIRQSRDREVYLNLKDCNMTDAGMNMMLSCSPKIRLKICEEPLKQITFFLEFFHKASRCSCDVRITYKQDQLNALLDLCSHVKNYETQTGRSFLPALQPIYQSGPDVWRINLSERKVSILLEVLKLQTEKKPVELMDCTDEESEVRGFLQCLPYISQLRIHEDAWVFDMEKQIQFLLNLTVEASKFVTNTGENFIDLFTSVCSFKSFICFDNDYIYHEYRDKHRDFLLDLCSHVKNYETQTGRSFLPALQPIYQSVPDVWRINLSERKISILLEVLKLQTEKKPVELMDWTDEESEVRGFLQCLPYISQLRNAERFIPSLCKAFGSRVTADQVTPLLQALDFTVTLSGKLPSSSCRSVGRVLARSPAKLNLTLKPQAVSVRGLKLLFKHITHLQKLSLKDKLLVKMFRALRSLNAPFPLTTEKLSLITKHSKRNLSHIQSSLTSLLRLLSVQCLDLTECKSESLSLTALLSLQEPLTIRFCKETLQLLVSLVCEAQDDELTRSFLKKVSEDLTSCSLTWEEIHYLLQHQALNLKLDFRKSKIPCGNIRELLLALDRIQMKRLSPSFTLSIIMEIYETRSPQYVSSLMSSTGNAISLNSRELDSVHCAALRFTLEHSDTLKLNLLWTSIPEEELESFLPLLRRVTQLSVDRLLLLKLLHCCSSSDLQQESAALLLAALHNRLDFSCCSALDLTDTRENQEHFKLTVKDCRIISSVLQKTQSIVKLILQDCEISDSALNQLWPILPQVQLNCSKALLLQFLACISKDGSESGCSRRTEALSQALGGEMDLSHTQMDQSACEHLALFLEYSEGLKELDLSHCKLTDHCMKPLMPHLHKTQSLDLSHNNVTDESAERIHSVVCSHSNIQTVRLFGNRIRDRKQFIRDERFEIW